MEDQTLGAKLGTATHLSPLLRKAEWLKLDACGLEQLALQRGCHYYQNDKPLPPLRISLAQFSNAELAIALLNPALRYKPQALRLGAAILGAEGNPPEEIAWLAKLERCDAVVRYVAECGRRYEPQNRFWTRLLELLPQTPPLKAGVTPHPSRFVAMTGITRRGVENVVEWIRPVAPEPGHGFPPARLGAASSSN